jgi:hypothetical protein
MISPQAHGRVTGIEEKPPMRGLLKILAVAAIALGLASGEAAAQWFHKPPPTYGWGYVPPRPVYVPPPVVFAPRPVYGWHHRPHWRHW